MKNSDKKFISSASGCTTIHNLWGTLCTAIEKSVEKKQKKYIHFFLPHHHTLSSTTFFKTSPLFHSLKNIFQHNPLLYY